MGRQWEGNRDAAVPLQGDKKAHKRHFSLQWMYNALAIYLKEPQWVM